MSYQIASVAGMLCCAAIVAPLRASVPAGTVISFQGQLKSTGIPLDGLADFEFSLWDADQNGSLVGSLVPVHNVNVKNGLFDVELDFGEGVFGDEARWLQVAVRSPAGAGGYTDLMPRTRLTQTPQAIHTRGLHVDATGQLSIGGAPAVSPLHVVDIGKWSWTVGNGWGDFSLNNGAVGLSMGVADAGGGAGDARIWTRGGTERLMFGNPTIGDAMTLSANGFVGIGTIDPQYTVDVQRPGVAMRLRAGNSALGPGLIFQNASAAPVLLGFLNFIGADGNARGSIIYDATDKLTFYTGGTERLTIDQLGRIGMGTSSPTGALDIHGSESNGTTGVLRLNNGNERLVFDGSEIDSNGPLFIHSHSNHNVVLANGGGDVGIGTGTPAAKLGVSASRQHPESVIRATNTFNGAHCQGTAPAIRGVMGFSSQVGVDEFCDNPPGFAMGAVWGDTGTVGAGVLGTSDDGPGVQGTTDTGWGVIGDAVPGRGGVAGAFNGRVVINGDLDVFGTVFKHGGAFKIDNPLDPDNKYLSHSFVESPDMMNVYNGNTVTDGAGYATVTLPDYFEALNSDFRYQLTVMGQFAQAIVSDKIRDNRFRIRTDKPRVEVSWQVTGIRKDKWAEQNRIKVEEDKSPFDKGLFRYPEGHGRSGEASVERLRRMRARSHVGPVEEHTEHMAGD